MLAIGETIVWRGLLYVFPALLLRWELTLGWSKTELTGAITLALVCSAFCSPLYGRLIDRGFGPYIMGCGALVGGALLMCFSVGHAVMALLPGVDRYRILFCGLSV